MNRKHAINSGIEIKGTALPPLPDLHQITQTMPIWLFSALQSGLYLQFSPGTGPAKVNSDLLAVKSSGCFLFFVLPGLFQILTTPFIAKLQPQF